MPQLDFATYASQIFWLLVTFAALYFLMARAALPRVREVLQNRQSRISNDLSKAEKLKEEAKSAEAEYKQALAEAKKHAQRVIGEVKSKMQIEEQARHAKLDQNFAKQTKEVEQRVVQLRKDAIRKLGPVTVETAQLMVQKLIGVQVDPKDVEKVVSALQTKS